MKKVTMLICMVVCNFGCSLAQNSKAMYYFNEGRNCMNASPGELTKKRNKQCIVEFTKAIVWDSKFWQAYRSRASAYYENGDYQKALVDLKKALNLTNGKYNPDLFFSIGECYYELGNYQAAIKSLTKAISWLGNPDGSYLLRAKAKWKLGMKKEACTDYKKAIKGSPFYKNEAEFINCN